jgi:hypothetical protein
LAKSPHEISDIGIAASLGVVHQRLDAVGSRQQRVAPGAVRRFPVCRNSSSTFSIA